MRFRRVTQAAFAAFFLTTVLSAQEALPPKFDVVSIRPTPPNAPSLIRDPYEKSILPGGQFIDRRIGLLPLIATAYSVKDPSSEVVGLPNWAKGESYAVSAKPAEGFPALSDTENEKQVRLMLRAMLADYFHLQLHTEVRQEQTFALEVAKGGLKIKEVDAPVPPDREGYVFAAMGDEGGSINGKKSTMAGMAKMLTIFVKRPITDQTGLKGYYDFDVKWQAPRTSDAPPAPAGFGADGVSLLISTLRDRFGLQLKKTNGPVEYWIVDHVERPPAN